MEKDLSKSISLTRNIEKNIGEKLKENLSDLSLNNLSWSACSCWLFEKSKKIRSNSNDVQRPIVFTSIHQQRRNKQQ